MTGLTNIVRIANSGATGFAVRGDGTVWSWGANASGALGNGSTGAYSLVPVQVSNMTGATDVAAGGSNGFALRNDGSVWAWGANTAGQLGNGSAVTQSTVPVKVTNLTAVTAIGAGRYNGYAVRNDGTVWAWGAGSDGANGNNNACVNVDFPCASRVPVQVSGLTGATTVTSFEYGGLALRTDGSIAGWGFNGYQTLANDSAYWTALTPVTAQGVPNVTAIGSGEYSSYALVP